MRLPHLVLLLAAAAIAGGGIVPQPAAAGTASGSGIITTISRSATMPVVAMPEGSEMWALWVTLPPGGRIEVAEPQIAATWMDLEITLAGSVVSASMPASAPQNNCLLLGQGAPVRFAGQEITLRQGDGFACDFGTGGAYFEENQGTQAYARAQLNVGGPWKPGMYDVVDGYRRAAGDSKALRIDAVAFRAVAKELRAAGMMTATTRIVTMPPGTSSLTTDRYPTLRMVTSGELKWGTGPAGASAQEVKGVFKLAPFNWVDWRGPQQVRLSNESAAAAEFVEWSVAPAAAAAP